MDRVLFKRYMEELQEMEALNKAFGKLDSDFCGFYISTAIILPIEILEDALNDDAHWLFIKKTGYVVIIKLILKSVARMSRLKTGVMCMISLQALVVL